MMNEPPWWVTALKSHDQGINTQLRLEVIRHRPADDLAGRHILQGGQIKKSLVGRDIREILLRK